MKLYIQFDFSTREVFAMQLSDSPIIGWVETNLVEYPNTMANDGCIVRIYYREDGSLEVVQEPIPQPTEAELAEERRLAYEAEADRYLIAMHGYEVEGKAEEAENCRKAYLAKKAEIRARFE